MWLYTMGVLKCVAPPLATLVPTLTVNDVSPGPIGPKSMGQKRS